jgi:hypothetical protein
MVVLKEKTSGITKQIIFFSSLYLFLNWYDMIKILENIFTSFEDIFTKYMEYEGSASSLLFPFQYE